MYGNEHIDSGSGGVVLTSMTKNLSYMTATEVITSFPSSTVEDKGEDDPFEELQPCEASEEDREETTHGGAAGGVHV